MGERAVTDVLLALIALLIPAVALVLEHLGDVRISERHHSHHDTYSIPASFTRALVFSMAFMGVLGVLMGLLCKGEVFSTEYIVVLGFFDGFVLTSFALWLMLCRYKVSTFSDCMVVTPFFGQKVWIAYAEIERLEWSGLRMGTGFRSLDVWIGGSRAARLYGIVDIEQIIMAMDRFDLLPPNP